MVCMVCLWATIGCQQQNQADSYQLFIAPDGNDQQAGTENEPLASLSRAMELIAGDSKKHQDYTYEVFFKEGNYTITEALKLEASNFQGSSLRFSAYQDGNVVLRGGQKVEGNWEEKSPNIWAISVTASFNQLFQDEKRYTRARWPNEGTYLHPAKINVKERWLSLPDTVSMDFQIDENTELCATGQWHFIRQKIASLDTKSNTLTTFTEIGPECSSTKVRPRDRIYLENNRAFLDAENEWYLDEAADTLYLYATQDPNALDFYYPLVESFFLVEGSPENSIRNISWEGITFQYSTWTFPEAERKGIQAGYWGTEIGNPVYSPPAVIMMHNAEDCTIKNCRFINLGEGAIAMEEGCFQNQIEYNTFSDIGSNVVQIARKSDYVGKGHPLHLDYEDSTEAPAHHRIANNQFQNVASVDKGAVAVWIGYAHHNVVEHNLIEDAPYSGISVGWRWDTLTTSAHHNEIAYNEVRRCMQYMSDGAGIYTVSNQPGTRIVHNWIHDIGGGEILAMGIYNDEGSGYMTIQNNYVMNADTYDYMAHQNIWGSQTILDNGCDTCENELQVKNERVKFSDFSDTAPPNPALYGIQQQEQLTEKTD